MMNGYERKVPTNLTSQIHDACADGSYNIVSRLIEKQFDINYEDKNKIRPIHIVCKAGYTSIVKLLIDHGCNIDCGDKDNWRPIHFATFYEHIEIIELLIKKNCNIDCQTMNKKTPIYFASSCGNTDIVDLLIKNNCSIEIEDDKGYKPVHIAYNKKHYNVVKMLIEKGCDVESKNRHGETLIHLACKSGHIDIVKLLIMKGCNINSENKHKLRPIHIACQYGHVNVIQLLIAQKCNIECETINKFRPIHIACQYGHVNIVSLLINNRSNIEIKDENNLTPIGIACYEDKAEIVKLLIENNCKIECEGDEKWNLINVSCQKGFIDVVQTLIKGGCNIESEGNNKRRPIHEACSKGHNHVAQLLIKNNCDKECEDADKWTPLHFACSGQHIAIVKLLIDNKCNIECEDKQKIRPIHLACIEGNFDIVSILIESKCEIECEDKNKRRPIHESCLNGNIEVVKLLIKQYCDIDCLTKKNKSPLDLAKDRCHNDCTELLTNWIEIRNSITENNITKFKNLYQCQIEAKNDKRIEISLLYEALNKSANRIVEYLQDRVIDDMELKYLNHVVNKIRNNSILRQNILYRCVRDVHADGFRRYCTADIINGNKAPNGQSFLQYCTRSCRHVFIDMILKKTVYNEESWDEISMEAVEMGYFDINDDIQERKSLIVSKLKTNFSLLHIAVIENDDDMVRYLLENNIVEKDINHDIFGTPQALAYSLCHRKCITVLEEFSVDPNTQNKFAQTPLHEAIESGTCDHCAYLIERCNDIDKAGFNNLTALHCAVMNGCFDICEKLMKHGADFTLYANMSPLPRFDTIIKNKILKPFFLSTRENALTLSIKFNQTILPCFLQKLNKENYNCCDAEGNTLLHLAALCLQPDVCRSLINFGANANERNNEGNTCLLELVSKIDELIIRGTDKIIETVHVLIELGADIKMKTRTGINVIRHALKFDNDIIMRIPERLLIRLFSYFDDDERQKILIDLLTTATEEQENLFDNLLKIFWKEIIKDIDSLLKTLIGNNKIMFALKIITQIPKDNKINLSCALQMAEEAEKAKITDVSFDKSYLITENIDDRTAIKKILKRILLYNEKINIACDMNLVCSSNCNHGFCYTSFLSSDIKHDNEIGSGSFGVVYKLTTSENNKSYALKFICNSSKRDSKSDKYIEENINKYKKIVQHENIVKYFGAFKTSEGLHIFMEYMEGGSLYTFINKNHSELIDKIVNFMRQILLGVSFLHSNNIIHRDIKPQNILMDLNDHLKLSDFGLSRSLEQFGNECKNVLSTDCGTDYYKAPEVKEKKYGFPADIWSVGKTFVHMLRGTVPDYRSTVIDIILIEGQENLTNSLNPILNKMLYEDPSQRSSAEDLLKEKLFL